MSLHVSQDCLACGTRSRYTIGEPDSPVRDWPHAPSFCSPECGQFLVDTFGPENEELNKMARAFGTAMREHVDRIILAAITGEALD